ncbi:MAG: TetR/AcrR family transcriptional regulator [Actinomycetota bacterium]|nr:TetR/AcrR family transcriptional regulator [Actinomycetota bacterium]
MESQKQTTTRKRNRRGEGQKLRDELIDAASRLLEQHGAVEALSLRAVATEAGVSAPSVYRHFDDLDDLLLAVVEARFGDFEQHLAAATDGIDDPFAALVAMGRAYLQFADEQPGRYQAIFHHGLADRVAGDVPFEEVPGSGCFVAIVDAVQRCLDAEPPDDGSSDERDAFRIAVHLWTGVHGIADLRANHPAFPWPPIDDLLTDMAEQVLPRRPSPG